MIRSTGGNIERAVDLLCQNKPHKLMRKSNPSERYPQVRLFPNAVVKPLAPADNERNFGRAKVSVFHSGGKFGRRQRFAAYIANDNVPAKL